MSKPISIMGALLQNCLGKHYSVKLSADALLKSGTGVAAAQGLHNLLRNSGQ